MNPNQAEEYLLDLEQSGMRFGLERMHRLTTALGMPQRRFASIHIVGSNGKSSTVRFVAAILERHGVRTGSYTSPHLRSFCERIEVGERPVGGHEFGAAVGRVAEAAELVDRPRDGGDRVTQFEALTAAAYHELARQRVEVAVVEAGLGGRSDATNVIPSKVQAITSVDLEHTRWLGSTVAEIAEEKLGVVRDHATLVAGDLAPAALAAAQRACARHHARLVRAPADTGLPLRALGSFQRRNFALAAAVAEAFIGAPLDPDAVRDAAAATAIAGRLEHVDDEPLTLYDGAHNPAGAEALAAALPALLGERGLTTVVGVLEDKDAAGMLGALAPLSERFVFTRSANPRSRPAQALAGLARELGAPAGECVPDPHEALTRARELAGPTGAVLATGSIYLVADLLRDERGVRMSAL